MANFPDVYYPVQGSNKFKTVSFPITRAFRIDFGAITTAGAPQEAIQIPKGSVVVGWVGRVVEAMEGLGAATISLGLGVSAAGGGAGLMVTSALASGAMTVGTIIAPHRSSSLISSAAAYCDVVYCSTGPKYFQIWNGATGCSAGKIDIFLTYIPLPLEDLSTKEFRQFVCT